MARAEQVSSHHLIIFVVGNIRQSNVTLRDEGSGPTTIHRYLIEHQRYRKRKAIH
jgi:hypothetical protein